MLQRTLHLSLDSHLQLHPVQSYPLYSSEIPNHISEIKPTGSVGGGGHEVRER